MYIGLALFLLIVFAVTFVVTFAFMDFLLKIRIEKRFDEIQSQSSGDFRVIPNPMERGAREILQRLQSISMPKDPEAISPIRQMFVSAGVNNDLPVLMFYATKSLLTFFLPIVFLTHILFSDLEVSFVKGCGAVLLLAAVGYYLPDLWLRHKIKTRKQEIFESFPDALDLMRVCVGAGLGLDAAIARVGNELEIKSAALAEEFRELNLQLRAGISRQEALKNLARRTDVEDINALVSMLIQSERFGTSISESLKVHADALRTKRTMRAQEAAGKIPVKLTIPMILCIFPALFVVILGPAVIGVLHALTPMFGR